MKKTLTLIGFFSLALLSACSGVKEPKGGTYDPNRKFKESEAQSLSSLGISHDLSKLTYPDILTPSPAKNSLDPYQGRRPASFSKKEIDEHPYPSSLDELFSKEAYFLAWGGGYFANLCSPEQGFYSTFYRLGDYSITMQNIISLGGSATAAAVYSHGQWSYIVSCQDAWWKEDSQGFLNLNVLYGLEFCLMEDYPYVVYMDRQYLYFMNRSTDFANDYIEEFNKLEDMHLIYA